MGRIHPEFIVASYRITTIRKAKQKEDGASMNESTMGLSERLPFDPEGHRRRRAPPFRTNPFGMLVVLALAIGVAMALVASVSLPSTRSATAAPNEDNLLGNLCSLWGLAGLINLALVGLIEDFLQMILDDRP